ncbi:MAG: hypothetical protein FWD81_02050 [Methanomassiliicoccaceae archaeon]|nr:hypothetical protein [Methanomassiliicoccaceae archaeon]
MSRHYLIVAAVGCVGMILAMVLLIHTLTSGDLFEMDVSDILLNIFIVIGIMIVSMLLLVFSMISYTRRRMTVGYTPTKRCQSCGAEMNVTEMSCPRCFSLQPTDKR